MEDYDVNQGVQTLPEEMLLQIFAKLSRQELGRVAQVCKRWQQVSYDPSLYESVELSQASYKPGTLGFVLMRGTVKLTIRGLANTAAFKAPLFLDEMDLGPTYNLKQLVNGKLHKGVPLILQRCSHLTDIRLITPSLNADLIHALALTSSLENLCIITCDWRPFSDTIAIVRGCRRLRVFNCRGYSSTLTEQEMFQLAGELPQTIQETNLFCSSKCISDSNVAALVECLPNLKELHLQHCPSLTDQSIRCLSELRNLKKLNITYYYHTIPVDAFRPLHQMNSLKTLALYGPIGARHFNALCSMLPNVTVIEQVDLYCATHYDTFWA